MKSQDIRPGMAINQDGQVWLVVDTTHVKPGKGPAYTQAKLKNLSSGKNVDKRFNSGENVDDINLDRREVEYLTPTPTGRCSWTVRPTINSLSHRTSSATRCCT